MFLKKPEIWSFVYMIEFPHLTVFWCNEDRLVWLPLTYKIIRFLIWSAFLQMESFHTFCYGRCGGDIWCSPCWSTELWYCVHFSLIAHLQSHVTVFNCYLWNLWDLFSFVYIVQGKWIGSSNYNTLLDPLNGEPFIKVAEVEESGVQVWRDPSLH